MIDVSLATLVVAVIGTIFTFIGTFFSGMSHRNERKQANEKLHEKIRKAFIEKMEWTSEGGLHNNETVFFNISIEKPDIYHFYGEIIYYGDDMNIQKLVFYFDKIVDENIHLNIHKTNGFKEYGLSKAKLKFINNDLFEIKFCKVWSLHHDTFIPDLPRKTLITPEFMVDSRVILTDNIIDKISPGRNYAKVKEILGISDKTGSDFSIFEDSISDKDDERVTSDLFFLKNALLKVTTLDKESIYSITVFPYDHKVTLSGILHPFGHNNNIIGEARVCKEILEHATRIESITTVRDSAKAIQNYTGAPFYKYITYFIDDVPKGEELVGQVIRGFSLSSGSMTFYIYDGELKG